MKVGELFEEQQDLDNYIMDNLKLKGMPILDKQRLIAYRLLAISVELGELAGAGESEKLGELVDIYHFVMSVALAAQLDIPYRDTEFKIMYDILACKVITWPEALEDFIIKFSQVANVSRSFKYWKSSDTEPIMDYFNVEYINMFVSFIRLGHALGYSAKEVESAYLKKNKINYNRQQSGY